LIVAASLVACGGTTNGPSTSCGAAQGSVRPLLQGAPHGILENLVAAGDYVYFNGAGTMSLMRVPVSGGAPETVVPVTDGEFAVAGGTVAWTPVTMVAKNDGTWTYESFSVTIVDAKGTTTLGLPSGTASIALIRADANGDVYYEADDVDEKAVVVMRWSAATRAVTEVSRKAALGWVDRGQIFWSDGAAFYVLDAAGGGGGGGGDGSPRMLAPIPAGEAGAILGVDADNLYYWLPSGVPNKLDGPAALRIGGVPRAGGAPFVAFESAGAYQVVGESVAVDDSGVYWIDLPGGANPVSTIYRAKLVHGSTEEPLAHLSSATEGIALDACAVYAAESGPSGEPQIVAVAK
jgi:hypothetical protein